MGSVRNITIFLNCLKRPKAGYRVLKALYMCAEIRVLVWFENRRMKKAFERLVDKCR